MCTKDATTALSICECSGGTGLTSRGDFGLLCKVKKVASAAENCEDQIASGGEVQFAETFKLLKQQAAKQAPKH